jgi:drug/metabolite transporter (DMT)-like permease
MLADGRFLVTGIPLESLWTPVLYTNTFSVLPALAVCFLSNELAPESLATFEVTSSSYLWLGMSCAFGIAISWSGFWCQSMVSATTYTVVGVMNKMLTVTVNTLIWDKHASMYGIASLCICLAGGSLYQQAPLREEAPEGRELETKPLASSSEYSSPDEGGSSGLADEEATLLKVQQARARH